MGRVHRIALSVVALIAVADSGAAQSAITEEEFLSALHEEHPALVAATDRLALAEGERARAGRMANPIAAAAWELPEETTQQSTWSLAWTPPLDGRRGLRIRASQAALDAASAEVESARMEARSSARAAFAAWAIGAERRSVTSAHLDKVRRLVSQMSARAESGEESGLAARRIELAAIELGTMLARMEAEEVGARRRATAWRPDAASAIPLRPALPEAPSEVGLASTPGVRARERELAQAEYETRLARRFFVFPELEAGWQEQEDAAGEAFTGPLFGVSWPLPLFDRQQGDRAAAARRVSAARARLEFTTRMAQAEIEGAREAYAALRAGALESMASLAETDALVEAASASYTLGESTLTDLLETLRSVLATRLAALDIYAAALEAHRNLETAAGRPFTASGGGR